MSYEYIPSPDAEERVNRAFDMIFDKIEKYDYQEAERRVYINDSQYFGVITPEVWQYRIGGYQVLEKWKTKPESEKSWWADRKVVEENDYILSASAYKPVGSGSDAIHRNPKEILKEIETEEEKLKSAFDEIKRIL